MHVSENKHKAVSTVISEIPSWKNRLDDRSRPEISVELDEVILQTLMEKYAIVSGVELAEKLGSDYSTVHRHLRAVGKASNLGHCVCFCV